MLLTTAQAYDLLAKHGVFVREACNRCGQVLGPVRYTRRGESGEWCSRECRGDAETPAIRKGGRPRKYRTPEQSRAAKTAQQRVYRDVAVWKKPPSNLCGNKGLAGVKNGSLAYPLIHIREALSYRSARVLSSVSESTAEARATRPAVVNGPQNQIKSKPAVASMAGSPWRAYLT